MSSGYFLKNHHLCVIWAYKDPFIRSTHSLWSVPAITALPRKSSGNSGREITVLTLAPTAVTIVGCLMDCPGYLPTKLK